MSNDHPGCVNPDHTHSILNPGLTTPECVPSAVALPPFPAITVVDLLTLIRDLTDSGSCWFDHNGSCQEHSWFETDPKCPHGRAQELLAALDARS